MFLSNKHSKRRFRLIAFFSSLHAAFWYFVPKIVLTYFEKKLFYNQKKFAKTLRSIYSNNERFRTFLETKYFFNLFLDVSHIPYSYA